MKRGKKTHIDRCGSEPGGFRHILIDYCGPSFSYLPRDVMFNVLLRLTVKSILVCKFVCKTWYDLISDPEFGKLHFDQSQPYPLIQVCGERIQSRLVYLMQPEVENFELKLERCDHSEYNSKCDCLVKFELDTKFKLPLRNLQMINDDGNDCLRLKMKDHKYRVVNSCNGLLCLSSMSGSYPPVVCNPVTGEFINLPKAQKSCPSWDRIAYGFGFSPKSNTYLVIRMIQNLAGGVETTLAEVHTLGTGTWKDIDFPHRFSTNWFHATYLNGFLYWPSDSRAYCAVTFDIKNECFGVISPPQAMISFRHNGVRVGTLGGKLSISCYFPTGAIGVWVLKDRGTTKAWSRVFAILSEGDKRWPYHYRPCEPVKLLNDGSLLMFHSGTNSLIYAHPGKRRLRYFKLCGTSADLEVTAHSPSFLSLKDALSGHDVKVHKSRCAHLKLQHEGVSFSVVEKDIQGIQRR